MDIQIPRTSLRISPLMMEIDESNRPDGLILAGGKSSRFGSNKATFVLENRRLVDWVSGHMRPVVSSLIISAGSAPLVLPQAVQVQDRVENRGPLEGLAAGFRESKKEWVLVCPVDMPLVDTAFFEKILLARTTDLDAVVATSKGSVGSIHPLCGVFKRALLESVDLAISMNHLRVLDWIATLNLARVEGEPEQLRNFNYPPQ